MYYIIFLLLFTASLIVIVKLYNRFVYLKNMMSESLSGIDVQLKRRHDLIPKLVECVKGYSKHEDEVLSRVTELRTKAVHANSLPEKSNIENKLSSGVRSLIAISEDYPDLKANTVFIDLQKQITDVENHIQMARRYYNGAVRDWNVLVEGFPGLVMAKILNYNTAEFFEADL